MVIALALNLFTFVKNPMTKVFCMLRYQYAEKCCSPVYLFHLPDFNGSLRALVNLGYSLFEPGLCPTWAIKQFRFSFKFESNVKENLHFHSISFRLRYPIKKSTLRLVFLCSDVKAPNWTPSRFIH